MKVVKSTFQRINKVPLNIALNAVGVYVLWKAKSRVRPAYIGQGNIIQRVRNHAKGHLDGFIAIFDRHTEKANKREAEIVEAVLLDIATQTDRFPTENKKEGNYKRVIRTAVRHGMLRVTVNGYDPLLRPGYLKLREKKIVTIKPDKEKGEGWVEVEHQWNYRPRV